MRYLILILLIAAGSSAVVGQDGVGIGTDDVNDDAIFEIESTTGGLLIPRMSTAQRSTLGASSAGLIVYDTNLQAFVYFDGSSWLRLVVQPAQVNLDMSNHKIVSLSDGTSASDAVNKGQMDAVDGLNLDVDGSDIMAGNLDMGSNRIVNLSAPVSANDAARNIDLVSVKSRVSTLESQSAREGMILTSFNNMTTPGIYFSGGSFTSDQPNSDDFYTTIVTANGSIVDQLAITVSSSGGGAGDIWFRRFNGSSWNAWAKVSTGD